MTMLECLLMMSFIVFFCDYLFGILANNPGITKLAEHYTFTVNSSSCSYSLVMFLIIFSVVGFVVFRETIGSPNHVSENVHLLVLHISLGNLPLHVRVKISTC